MLVAGFLTVLRPWLVQPAAWLYYGLVPELWGVVRDNGGVPMLNADNVLSGRLQRALETWVSENIPQRDLVVRGLNEFMWRSFGTSFMSNGTIVLGKERTLFEMGYILSYCGLQEAPDTERLRNFAMRMRAAQEWFARRGQTFVYMLAPVKTSWFPDRIPSSFPCPTEKRDRIYRQVVAVLSAEGVNVVDARAALEAVRVDQLAVELFPRNGTHWNWLGAAMAANAIVDKVRSLDLPDLPRLSYKVQTEPDELSFDRDLSALLNLLSRPPGAPSPVIIATPQHGRSTDCTFAAVNDSFLHQPAYLLQTGGIFRNVETNSYFNLDRRHFPDWRAYPVDLTAPNAYAFLFAADVVVLEEIESRVGGPFAMQFLELVEREQKQVPVRAASLRRAKCQVAPNKSE
jgi:hypothetical protein